MSARDSSFQQKKWTSGSQLHYESSCDLNTIEMCSALAMDRYLVPVLQISEKFAVMENW